MVQKFDQQRLATGDVEFLVNVGDVLVCGRRGDVQDLRDVRGGDALADEVDDFDFAVGQLRVGVERVRMPEPAWDLDIEVLVQIVERRNENVQDFDVLRFEPLVVLHVEVEDASRLPVEIIKNE